MCLFDDLARFALAMLSLRLNNASAQRMFSEMALIKTKLHNRIKQPLLESIIRDHMLRNNSCCNKFWPSKDMYRMCDGRIYVNAEDAAIAEDF